MSILGIVLGTICLAGACKSGMKWWNEDDDKAALWTVVMLILVIINWRGSF